MVFKRFRKTIPFFIFKGRANPKNTEVNLPKVEQPVTNGTLRLPTPPTAIPLIQIIKKLPTLFPRSINASFTDYRMFREDYQRMQWELLETLPFFPHPSKDKQSRIIKTFIDNEGNYINEFFICPTRVEDEKKLKHLIFIHGYGAGLGFFLKNFENIPLFNNNWCIHAIDLPGFGFSSRKTFPFKYPDDNHEKVEDWFHQRLQNWFSKRNLLENPSNNVVVAHSLGAYLMILYKKRFISHFRKMIICSPAGIKESENQNNEKKIVKSGTKPPPWWYNILWNQNLSPFSLVRNSGFLGSKITSGWSYRRFKNLRNKFLFERLHKYSYAIFNRPGSGEYLLAFALKCGGDPRISLHERIFQEKKDNWDPNSEWVWLYGDNDWMDVSGGSNISNKINSQNLGKSKIEIIPNAGHHLYFDNYSYFNKLIEKEMLNLK